MLTVLLGGARSGKSTTALRLACTAENEAAGGVSFVATSPHIEGDDDLAARIARHRDERPPTWSTVEAEIDLAGAVDAIPDSEVVVVDCLTVWVGNLLHHGHDDAEVLAASDRALAVVAGRPADTIVVTNEVGSGIVPADAASRRYRDLLGRVNQAWVAASDRALLLVAGRALDLHDLPDLPDPTDRRTT